MVGVNAATRAEEMPGRVRIELVPGQHIFALDNRDPRQRHRRHDRAFAPADRTVATAWIDNAVGQIQLQNDRAAMARGAMLRFDFGAADVFYHFLGSL
jgi:hypothetical protein